MPYNANNLPPPAPKADLSRSSPDSRENQHPHANYVSAQNLKPGDEIFVSHHEGSGGSFKLVRTVESVEGAQIIHVAVKDVYGEATFEVKANHLFERKS